MTIRTTFAPTLIAGGLLFAPVSAMAESEAAKSLGALPPLARVIHMAALYDPGKFTDLDPERAALRPQPKLD